MQISVNFLINWFASKEKSFASGQKVVCKKKPFASGLLASKSMQTLSELVCWQVTKYKGVRNALVNRHFLSNALQVPKIAIAKYIWHCNSLSEETITI